MLKLGQTFYIADLHFGHKNILSYDNREFKDINEHDEELIKRWNEAVGIDDEVWILGDVSWYGVTQTVAILKRLNGIKKLCIGNHDKKLLRSAEFRAQFAEITNYKEIQTDDGSGVVLCHYPIPCFNNHFNGWVHLYGHVHNSFEWNMMRELKYQMTDLYERPCKMYNVGCMIPKMHFTPRTLEYIIETPDLLTLDEMAKLL